MGLLDNIFGGNEDPKLNALIDTNHRLTVAHTDMLNNYATQVADIKARVERLEAFIQENFKDAK
jgi:hypothetical protein